MWVLVKVVATTWFSSPMVTSWEAGAFRVYPSTSAACASSVMVQVDPALTFVDFSEAAAPVTVSYPSVPSVQV